MTIKSDFCPRAIAFIPLLLAGGFFSSLAQACGGFFCQFAPINQAGEQIVFKQEGDTVTALILIQYQGEAKDFSWVLPVPGIPELKVGSELIFSPLELATRPQFELTRTGEACPSELDFATDAPAQSNTDQSDDKSGVTILQTVSVGPFDAQIITSDDANALASWLQQNNFDLTKRGAELIKPYVDEQMNFVTLKLSQNQGVGDIQPLLMKYTSATPMIPIRLTAVAAQPNMGIIVWLLGSARAIPVNYLHVTPNYTRLNWYAGTLSAYSSYQTLITAAMDEAGGQGFATDYAGTELDYLSQLPSATQLSDTLSDLASISNPALFLASLFNISSFPSGKLLESFQRNLPTDSNSPASVYRASANLEAQYTLEQLESARTNIVTELQEKVITPLTDSLAMFDKNLYLSRLYTTLSPEEMTLDPVFDFNQELTEQALLRQATLHSQCLNNESFWTLRLGPGTGREGEMVIEAVSEPPTFGPPSIDQMAVWRTEIMKNTGSPELVTQNQFSAFEIGNVAGFRQLANNDEDSSKGLFGAALSSLSLALLLLIWTRRNKSR